MDIEFAKLSNAATIPCYAHKGDSGMDIASCETVGILPNSWALIHTGIAPCIPSGHELQVRGRSGMQCKRGVLAAFGTVDEGYRGEICVALYNLSNDIFTVNAGDRIAQLVLAPVRRCDIREVPFVDDDTERGTNGFGSSGVQGAPVKQVANSNQIDNTDYYRLPCGKFLEDFIAWKGMNFAEGSALKYTWRSGRKDGESATKDNAKAMHYIKFLAQQGCVDVEQVEKEVGTWFTEAMNWNGECVRK